MPSSKSPNLIAFWLPIILAVIALIGTFAQVFTPAALAVFRGAPTEPTTTTVSPGEGRSNSDNGCLVMADKQICWGRAELAVTDKHTRSFGFQFHEPFAGTPILATSLEVKSSGYAFAVYNSTTDETKYVGNIVEVEFRANTSPVVMSYIAIGRPRGG